MILWWLVILWCLVILCCWKAVGAVASGGVR